MLNYNFEKSSTNFMIFYVIRSIVGVFLIQNVHKSDEYYQGPEVAHHMVYGTGELTWEWIYKDPIRSPIFPMFYAIGYYILNILGLSGYPSLSFVMLRLMQALIGASFDTMLLKLNQCYHSKQTNRMVVFLNLTNWVSLTYFCRTYVNSVQALLTLIAYYLWLKGRDSQNGYQNIGVQQNTSGLKYDILSRMVVVLCFVVRGTSLLFWMVAWPYELIMYRNKSLKEGALFVLRNLATLFTMIGVSVLVSSLWYQKLLWTQYNFFYNNIVLGFAKLCGSSSPIMYFTIYQYKLFGFSSIFTIYGVYNLYKKGPKTPSDRTVKDFFIVITIVAIILTQSSHKELRFILILFPFQIVLMVRTYNALPRKLRLVLMFLYLVTSSYYFVTRNVIYKRGGLTVINYIRDHEEIKSVLYHIEAYQLPMHSYIHRNVTLIMPEFSFETALDGTAQRSAKEDPTQFVNEVTATLGHPPDCLITTDENILNGKLKLPGWTLVLNQWYPSIIDQDYDRRIHLYKYGS